MMGTVFMWIMIVALGGMSVVTVCFPKLWVAGINRILGDPWIRFWAAQGMILMGLLLILGTSSFSAYVFWVVCGVVFIGKGGLLLAGSDGFRVTLSAWVHKWPFWVFRIYGILLLGFVGFLTMEVIRHG